MANPMVIKKRIKVIKNKMQVLLNKIQKDYQSGAIKSPIELQQRIFKDMQHFYDSIGESTLQVIEASGPPYSKAHNEMIRQTYNDISMMQDELKYLGEDLTESFNQVELDRKLFEKRIEDAYTVLKDVEISSDKKEHKIVFKESFKDVDLYLKDATKFIPAHVFTTEGILTLQRLTSDTHNPMAKARIINGNGLPGNTHLIRSTGESLKFDGEDGLHTNLADIFDEMDDTWFEYEAFNINDHVRAGIQGKGMAYKEGIKWIKEIPEGLYLELELFFEKPILTNWFSIKPFIPYDSGAISCKIEEIQITDGKGTTYELSKNEQFNESKGYMFPKIECQSIRIKLHQRFPYKVDAGHFYFKQTSVGTTSVLENNSSEEGIIIHGEYPSVNNLNVSFDAGTNTIVYPTVSYKEVIKDSDAKKKALFIPPNIGPSIVPGVERIMAERYMIGMRDATIANYQFAKKGEYVSVPFVSETPIKAIELLTDYHIPKNFDPDTEWIHFSISIDGGGTWHDIYSLDSHQANTKTKYLINSNTPKEAQLDEIGYIDTLNDIYSVQVRIIMDRPIDIPDASFYTPFVSGYEVHTTTNEESA